MQTLVSLGVAASFGFFALGLHGCGASHGAGEAANAPSPVTSPPAGGSADAGSPAGDMGSTTTTAPPADAGDSQGSKLAEARSGDSASASAGSQPKGPHQHDPGRGPTDIRAIIVARRDEARACYDHALLTHPGIEGDLVIQWTIDPKGAVSQVSLDSSRSQITEPTVVACIVNIVKKIQFAASPGGFETKANYPFNFHPRQGKPAGGQ
jgi:hypothetical protein